MSSILRAYADLYSEDELEWADRADEFVRSRVEPFAAEIDRGGRCRELVREMGSQGLLGSVIPKEYGGQGLRLVPAMLIAEEISASSPSLAAMRSVSDIFVGMPLLLFGSEQQKSRWLPVMGQGEQSYSLGLTEPAAGSDAGGIATRAAHAGGEYLISGTKHYISGAAENDAVLIYAVTDESAELEQRLSAFLVPLDSAGIEVTPIPTTGLRGFSHARIELTDVSVEADRLVGREGQGFEVMMAGLIPERIDIAARSVGCGHRALIEATKYADQRHQFGRAISRFQGVSHKIATMRTVVDAARLLVLRAARQYDSGTASDQAAAEAKLFAAQECFGVCDDALQVTGARGYTSGTPVDLMFRDIRALRFGGGTDEIMRHVIQREEFRHARVLADVAVASNK